MGEEMIQRANQYALMAERKMGGILKATERHSGGRPKTCHLEGQVSPPTLPELGITRKEAMRAEFLSDLPDEEFEEILKGKKSHSRNTRETYWMKQKQRIRAKNGNGLFEKILL